MLDPQRGERGLGELHRAAETGDATPVLALVVMAVVLKASAPASGLPSGHIASMFIMMLSKGMSSSLQMERAERKPPAG